MTPYPRDMIGYGAHPPHARWPGEARVALQIVLNYEEGGENNVLHGDRASETFLSEIIGAQGFEMRHLSMESIYEYGSRAGFWRLIREFERRALPVTIFGVSMAWSATPSRRGHGRGRARDRLPRLRWISYQQVDEATERSTCIAQWKSSSA
jgi:peptidoglycan/xylan/chitin deacetylase (PgdA/CDA1 family)